MRIAAAKCKVDVNLDGTTTVTNFSEESSITAVSTTPEPNNFELIVIALGAIAMLSCLKRRAAKRTNLT